MIIKVQPLNRKSRPNNKTSSTDKGPSNNEAVISIERTKDIIFASRVAKNILKNLIRILNNLLARNQKTNGSVKTTITNINKENKAPNIRNSKRAPIPFARANSGKDRSTNIVSIIGM